MIGLGIADFVISAPHSHLSKSHLPLSYEEIRTALDFENSLYIFDHLNITRTHRKRNGMHWQGKHHGIGSCAQGPRLKSHS